jgi:uncharacterized protein (DUF342 family)
MSDYSNEQQRNWFRIDVSEDRMQAFLIREMIPDQAEMVRFDSEQVYNELSARNIVFGLIHEAINRAVETGDERMLIARGKDPIPGRDASLKCSFDSGVFRKAVIEDSNSRVDLSYFPLVQNVSGGEVVAEIFPAGSGEDGMDVYGNAVKAVPGRDLTIQFGNNVVLNPGKTQVLAKVSGEPMFNGSLLEILPVKVIEGDVHGAIKFQGSLVVTGNIGPGSAVVASGDITIYGGVEQAAEIRSGGHLFVRGGIQDTAMIFCVSDFSARELIKSQVNCGGNLSVGDSIINSRLEVEKNVLAEGGRGQIAGGVLRCGGMVSAKSIGSRLGLDTVLEVGVSSKLKMDYQALEAEVRNHRINLDKVTQAIGLLRKTAQLTSDKAAMLESLEKTRAVLDETIMASEQKKDNLFQAIYHSARTYGRIIAKEIINPGVKVVMGRTTCSIREEIRSSVLWYTEEREIEIRNIAQ